LAGETATAGRLPDFYIVGHSKSGTTAMYEMLAQHPQVHVGAKEPRYFASELYERDIPRPGGTPRTLEDYRAWFSGAGPAQLVGDVSPDYLWCADSARMIAEVTSDAHIVAIFREPASFLASLHRQLLKVGAESEPDLGRALALEPERREGRSLPLNAYWPRSLLYSDHVRYLEQLRRFHEHFPRERVLVLIYDDFRRDNAATMAEILRFIGVDDRIAMSPREANQSVEIRAARANAALRKLVVAETPAARALKSSLISLTPMRLRQRALRATRDRIIFGEVTPPDEAVLARLRRELAGEVRAFGEYIGRDLVSLWGYEGLEPDSG
jgi:hypothetical protein